MGRRLLGLKRNEQGTAMTEFALVAPVLLLMVMAMLQFGWIFHGYLVVTQGAREGVRRASVHQSNLEITQAMETTISTFSNNIILISDGDQFANNDPDVGEVWILIDPTAPSERSSGSTVSIKVKSAIGLWVPDVLDMLPDPFVVYSDASMRME